MADIYDSAFIIQGNKKLIQNVNIKKNIFVDNSRDIQISTNDITNCKGIVNYLFEDNLSVNQGKGWGNSARPDKDDQSFIYISSYESTNTKIIFNKNHIYNPSKLYLIEDNSIDFFKENSKIQSDYNIYYLKNETKIFGNSYTISEKQDFI